jgi:hypothetical protein
METKNPLMSKTLWFNFLTTIVAGIPLAMGKFPELAPYAVIGTAVVNFLLRFVTKQPVV